MTLGTLLYAPGIKVYITTEDNGTLDVSDDLTDGTLVRRSDGVSTFNFQLQNARRKYDGRFAPNDRIIVMLKRFTWLRVFTGYLNSVPLITAWPRVVPFSASCSLKRLQYWYWDPGLSASQNMVATALNAAKNPDDGGVSNAVLTILKDVVGWPEEKVHIAGIPEDWFKFAYKIAQDVDALAEEADEIAAQFYGILGGSGSVGGNTGSAVATGTLKPGTYGGVHLDAQMARNAEIIYNVGHQVSGITDRDIVTALMAAMQESSLHNLSGGDRDSAGLFQMRPSMGWGSHKQVTNPQYASKKFFTTLKGVKGRARMSPTQAAQAVERSATPSAYARWQRMAEAVVKFLNNKGSGKSLGSDTSFQNNANNWQKNAQSGKQGKSTGADLLQTALTLVKNHPHIPYRFGGDSPPQSKTPTALDCSSFVQWCIYHTTGGLHGCPRTSQAQSSWCKSKGKIVSASQGMKTKGALMFRGGVGAAHHVEISLGDGKHTVGAHHTGTYCGVISSSASYWSEAGIVPDMAYDVGAGGGGGGGGGDTGVPVTTASTQPWYNPNDKFDRLFGNNPWVANFDIDTAFSEALGGVRALLNDQPLLPYLKNLFNSTMRSFCSAPNGDLIAWFPDYYGIWGTSAAMVIEPIELKDFYVEWSDDFFVTHQFTVAPLSRQSLDLATGVSEAGGPLSVVTTTGIASIDVPSIMYALFGLEPTKEAAQKFIDYIYKRFGARPDFQQMPGVIGPKGEFFSALFLFMRQWAYQYNADIPITFMPELWPGMLVKIPEFDFQAYVTTVTHSFQMGESGGFSTTINIAAPARLSKASGDRSNNLIGLPVAGGLFDGAKKLGKP